MAHQSSVATASVTRYSPEPANEEPVDLTPSDSQPPGTDEKEYQSLEDALLGE